MIRVALTKQQEEQKAAIHKEDGPDVVPRQFPVNHVFKCQHADETDGTSEEFSCAKFRAGSGTEKEPHEPREAAGSGGASEMCERVLDFGRKFFGHNRL